MQFIMNFKTKTTLLLILTNFFLIEVYSQIGFNRTDSITVLKINGDTLKNPWAGGFNFVQFSEIDLNLDGIKDLFVFDREGSKISTFINEGIANEVSYRYDPSYTQFFPKELNNWVLLRDYNCDGKMDIISSYYGFLRAYKNNSTTQLSFVLDVDFIQTIYNPDISTNTLNLSVSLSNIPAIDDIDGDGDLDILTFDLFTGSNVEYHKNLSMENYGTCDSLKFEVSNKCWGFFQENNGINLYDTCINNVSNPQKPTGGNKHSGSTLFTLDVDGNNSKDLVLSDGSSNNFTMLTNGDVSPNLNKSSMIVKDSLFPKNNNTTTATSIETLPAGFYLDVNNDNIKDLIAAPYCEFGCNNNNNVWYYNNSNATNNPDFNLQTNSFLQEGMIEVGEGAHPVFFDYNADGLMDIVVGNYGEYDSSLGLIYRAGLWLYKNIGTTTVPSYQLITKDYVGISTINLDIDSSRPTLGLHPAFKDLDGDNDPDMILGDYNGHIHYFTNTAGAGNTAVFTLTTPDYLNIDVGNNATPLLHDLDKDGLIDLIIGKEIGFFSYYKNTGTASTPNFNLMTDSLGKAVTMRVFDSKGNSSPIIIDSAGTTLLFSGSSNGSIYKFGNIDSNLTGTFSIDSIFHNIWEGINSIVFIGDANNDGSLDMLVGNQSGGVAFYKGNDIPPPPPPPIGIDEKVSFEELNIYPNPTKSAMVIDIPNNEIRGATIEVIDLLGKTLVQQKIIVQKTTINLDDYAKGVYLLKFSNQKESKVYKIIKE